MAYLTEYLDTIRGYTILNGRKNYNPSYYSFDTVRDAISIVLSTICDSLYPEVDIESELTTINSASWGPNIRDAIYDASKKLLNAANKTEFVKLAAIRTAHYGSDMREPLYYIFKSLGAEDSRIGHPFSTSDENDFYTDDMSQFCVRLITRGGVE